ncbi:MAG: hypothetical protein V4734_02335 [Terriglobus sp.]
MMPAEYTYPVALLGMTIFLGAVFARGYMMHRVDGGMAYSEERVERYQELVREGQAPRWPLTASWVCIPVGIAIAFGSILFSR